MNKTFMTTIEGICESVAVVPLSKRYFAELDIDATWVHNRAVPVGLFPSQLITDSTDEKEVPFPLLTFYPWLRSGFRIVQDTSERRFEVYKGLGLLLPKAYELHQPAFQRVFRYQLLPNEQKSDSHYKILNFNDESRIAGCAYLSLLKRDIRGYQWLEACPHIRVPKIMGAFSFSKEYCSQYAVPEGSCGQIIRRFLNPFRIMDLQFLKRMALKSLPSERSFWQGKAEAILSISMQLTAGSSCDYLACVGNALGRTAGALTSLRILHGSLTDHCQNVTLAGELTEFDFAVRQYQGDPPPKPYFDSRLYTQILLLANHLRHLVDCIRWIGVDCRYSDCVEPFMCAVAESVDSSQYEAFLYHLNHDPYCLDLSRSVCNRYFEKNLCNCDDFLSIVRQTA